MFYCCKCKQNSLNLQTIVIVVMTVAFFELQSNYYNNEQ